MPRRGSASINKVREAAFSTVRSAQNASNGGGVQKTEHFANVINRIIDAPNGYGYGIATVAVCGNAAYLQFLGVGQSIFLTHIINKMTNDDCERESMTKDKLAF